MILKFLSFILSIFFPRNSNILVFGDRSGDRFSENSRYLFQFFSKNLKKKRCIWLTKKNSIYKLLNKSGYECFLNNSFYGIYYGFRARWHIFNYSPQDTSVYTSIGANHLNLWTGVQIKKLKRFKYSNRDFFLNFILRFFHKKKYFLYPNSSHYKFVQEHYNKKEYNHLLSNFPKELIFNKKNKSFILGKEKKIINKITRYKGKIIGYFPTWRDDGREFYNLINNISFLSKLNNLLKKNDSMLILKPHSTAYEKNSKVFTKFNLSQFLYLDYDFDLNLVLSKCDLLISDYSGVIFDFLYFNKQMILFLNDINKYKKEPGLTFDYKNFKIGYRAYNLNQLLSLLKKFLASDLKDKFKLSRENYKKKFNVNNNSFITKITTTLNSH